MSNTRLAPIHKIALRLTSSFFCCNVGGLRLVDMRLYLPSLLIGLTLTL